MRLPWPFGRSQAAPAEDEPKTDPGATAEVAVPPAFPTGPAVAPSTGAWSKLPPIQRVSGDPPLVAPASKFLADVPGANELPPIVGQLGHDVTPLAPAGLVVAPVHPVAALTSHDSLVDRPVQRRAAQAAPAEESAAWTPEPAPAPAAAVPPAPAPTPAPASGATGDAAPAGPAAEAEPARRLSVVPGNASAAPPARSLTRADAWTPPAAAERPLVHRTNVQASTSHSTGTSTSTASEAAGSGAPRAAPEIAATAANSQLQLTAGDAQLPAAPSSTPRRAGLGAPLAAAPPTAMKRSPAAAIHASLMGLSGPAAVQRISGLAGSPPIYSTLQRRGPAARSVTPEGDTPAPGPTSFGRPGSPGAPFIGSPLGGTLPSLPVVSRHVATPSPDAGESSSPPPDGDPVSGAPREPSATRGTASTRDATEPHDLPLVARTRTDLATESMLQRAPAAGPGTSASSASSVTPSSAARRPLVGARSLRPATGPQATPAETAVPSTDGFPFAPAPHSPPSAGAAQGVIGSQTWTHPAAAVDPALQRALERAVPPTQPAASVQRAPAPAVASSSLARPDRGEAPQMTLARFAGPVAASTTVAGSDGSAGMVLPAGSPVPASGTTASPSVQTTTATTPAAPVLAPTATAVVQREDAAAPSSPAEGQGQGRSEGDLEELARALFPRFQRQLRMEYVYEREARGLPFDS